MLRLEEKGSLQFTFSCLFYENKKANPSYLITISYAALTQQDCNIERTFSLSKSETSREWVGSSEPNIFRQRQRNSKIIISRFFMLFVHSSSSFHLKQRTKPLNQSHFRINCVSSLHFYVEIEQNTHTYSLLSISLSLSLCRYPRT